MDKESFKIMENSHNHWWYKSRIKILDNVLKNKFSICESNKILEIGCGTGANIDLLSKYGELFAVEMDEESRKISLAKSKNIKDGNLPDNIPFNDKFSLVCLLDVLEHIQEDEDSLKTIFKLTENNGKLLLTVPAYQFLWNNHDDVCHHKRRYTLKDLEKKVINSGFSIEYSSYFNNFLFAPIAMTKILMKFQKKAVNSLTIFSNESVFSKIQNSIFEFIFSLERKFIPKSKFNFGISIIILAEKIK